MKKFATIFLLGTAFTLILLPIFFRITPKEQKQHIVARVADIKITMSEFKKRLNKTYASFSVSFRAKEKLLNRLIVEKLLEQEAKDRGITVSKEDLEKYSNMTKNDYSDSEFERQLLDSYETNEGWLKTLKKYILLRKTASNIIADKIKLNTDTATTYYNTYLNPNKQEQVELAQIFTSSKQKAQQAEKELESGIEFTLLAKKYSEAPEAINGGYVGIIQKNTLPKVFDYAFKMDVNKYSPILRSVYGYHILKLISKNPEDKKQKQLASNYLMVEQDKRIYKEWLAEKLKSTKIFKNLALINSIE